MSDDKPIDPRISIVIDVLNSWSVVIPFDEKAICKIACEILVSYDAYDAQHGIVRVHQSSIDNDAARIAAAQRAGQEIREALGLSATASWAEVLAAASGVPRYEL